MNTHPAFKMGNVAVITGGASGIGFAAAKKYASFGMRICLADINEAELKTAAQELATLTKNGNSDVITLVTDVSDITQLEKLREYVYAEFNQVNILMNNAGIGARAGSWDGYENWQKTLNVNLWGVINGVQTFTAAMLAQNTPGLIINTGSKQGITCPPGNTPYNTSKAAVKAMTEGLQHSLRNEADGQISAHLLVPGFVYTGMMKKRLPEKPDAAWTPEQTIDYMIKRLNNGDFYILCPDNEVTEEMDSKRILWGANDLASNRPALSRWHPDYLQDFNDYMSEE